jgi:hypothetical protein
MSRSMNFRLFIDLILRSNAKVEGLSLQSILHLNTQGKPLAVNFLSS